MLGNPHKRWSGFLYMYFAENKKLLKLKNSRTVWMRLFFIEFILQKREIFDILMVT